MSTEQHPNQEVQFPEIEIKLPFHRTWQLRTEARNFAASKKAFEEVLKQLRINDHDAFALQFAFDEIVINAMKHGNQSNPDAIVEVNFDVDQNQAILSVEDEGPGIDRTAVSDPTKKDTIMKTGGRGIYMTEKLVDEMSYEGSKITMKKVLSQE